MQHNDDVTLHAHQLCKHYGDVAALDGLSLDVARGEIYGLLGANGAGKTTTLRIICGLLAPDSGEGHCLDSVLGQTPAGLGYVPQRGGLYDDLSITENLRFFARAHGLPDGRGRVRESLTTHALGARAGQRVGTLSGGWRQRVALAAALLHEPRLLLLDEPSAGLDPAAREALWLRLRGLAASGMTVLLTTHYADEAERCDRIGYLDRGRLLVEGLPQDIAAQLAIRVWRIGADAGTPPETLAARCVRDALGWRFISTLTEAPPELGIWSASAKPEQPRLNDALSWLAANQGANA